jgi:DNA-binding beta-propeller fold protein YncE
VAVDRSTGNVYVADRFNNAIRMIAPGGVVTTIAGPTPTDGTTPGPSGFADGTGSAARFNWPGALAVDRGTGDVYVADYNNNAIRRLIPSSGALTTVVGYPPGTSPAPVGVVLGPLPGALSGPTSVVVSPAVPAQNIPLQLSISDSRENALLLATMP